MRFLLVLAAVSVASVAGVYRHCNLYQSNPYMLNKCEYCANTYKNQYICRGRKSHLTYDPYEVNVHNPHGRGGYGYGYNVNVYTDGDYYENHEDPSCFWQCDEYGQAFAKPCPYGQRFDRYARVCVSGPGNVHSNPHSGSGYGRSVHGNPHSGSGYGLSVHGNGYQGSGGYGSSGYIDYGRG